MIKVNEYWSIHVIPNGEPSEWFIIHSPCLLDNNDIMDAYISSELQCDICTYKCPNEVITKANFIMNNENPYEVTNDNT